MGDLGEGRSERHRGWHGVTFTSRVPTVHLAWILRRVHILFVKMFALRKRCLHLFNNTVSPCWT
jgi:hypothetical protein